tara:strand:- start:2748 stop:3956 length:1209 start_codon:yes stop_codon:yes gene_type:complete
MPFNIENAKIFKRDSCLTGFISFTLKSKQNTRDNITLAPSKDFIDIKKTTSFSFSNNIVLKEFRNMIQETPLTNSLIHLYDFHGNNVGKYLPDRTNNNGGTINIVTEPNVFLADIVSTDNSVIFLDNYHPFLHKYTNSITLSFLEQDKTLCGDKFKNTIVYVNSKLYKKFLMLDSNFFSDLFKRVVSVPDNESCVQTCIEQLFGKVITGKPPYISTFLQIIGGNLDSVLVDNKNCSVSHRTDNRIQFVSNSTEAEATVVCFINNFPDTVCIEIEDCWKKDDYSGEVIEFLDISETPKLNIEFYHRLISLKCFNEITTKENFKETCLANSELIINILLDNSNYYTKELNKLEVILIGNFSNEMSDFTDKFYGNKYPITQHREFPNVYSKKPNLLRESTCATNF